MPATAALSSTITVPIVLNVRIQSGARARIACPVQLTAQSCRPRKARFYLAKGKVFVHGTWRHLLSEGTAFDSFLSKVFECHAKRTCEVEMRSRRGNPMFIEFAGVAENEAQKCFVTATDITARKHEQFEREELQSQLAQSRKMEAVGTLAKGIAHDFNNILAGLLGGLSLLNLELGDSDAHHSDIQEMEALVQRGANLTKQLLGFGSRGHYDVRPLDLADVVTKTSAMFARTRRDISMHVDMASDLRAVLADHSQLEQVLLNLLVNAGQAMPAGGRIYLSAVNTELSGDHPTPPRAIPGQYVKLKVADTGVGMDAATQARIFEPLFTTKGPGQGTGLGLASAHKIIKDLLGFITVESKLGWGSIFELIMPAAHWPTASENPPARTIQHGTGTILVVDDEAQMVNIYARLLGKIGYGVLTSTGGQEALEILRRHRETIAAVILDMIMPDMNGCQIYRAMREMAPDIKVLLCTGYSVDGPAQEILATGCCGYLRKSFDAATLSTKLRQIIERHPAAS